MLTEEECQESINDIWKYVETAPIAGLKQNTIDRNNWTTCNNSVWPGLKAEGILPQLATSKVALERRQNPKIHEVFAELLGTQEIMSNHDRYSFK